MLKKSVWGVVQTSNSLYKNHTQVEQTQKLKKQTTHQNRLYISFKEKKKQYISKTEKI